MRVDTAMDDLHCLIHDVAQVSGDESYLPNMDRSLYYNFGTS